MNLKRLSHTIHYNTKLYPKGIRSIVRGSDIENCTVKEKVLGAKSYQYLIFYAARTFAVRSLRFFWGSGWISKATFALRKGSYIRARDGGEADKPPLSLEINP